MTDISCTYGHGRDEAIVAFLYEDADAASPAERARFETHLRTCAHCAAEVAALRGVRAQLSRWAPPEPHFVTSNLQSAFGSQHWWRSIPAWAQVAAALLVLGVSAGIANLDIRYDRNGISVRTGWSRPATVAGQTPPPGAAPAQLTATAQTAPWRADLAALERQLKTEFRAAQASSTSPAAARMASVSDAEITRRVRALVEDSEKRQQRELALRIAELLRDVSAQRQADLVKIDRTLGVVQNSVGLEVMKNRQQINQMDLLYRASQRQ